MNTQLARTTSALVSAEGDIIIEAGTIGTVLRVIEQEGMDCDDLEVEYPNGIIEVSPADTFEPVER